MIAKVIKDDFIAYQSIHGAQTQMDDATVHAIYKGADSRLWQWHKSTQEQTQDPKPQASSYQPRSYPQGSISNNRITARNGGVQHQFINSIGGCSSNYK